LYPIKSCRGPGDRTGNKRKLGTGDKLDCGTKLQQIFRSGAQRLTRGWLCAFGFDQRMAANITGSSLA